MTAAAEYARGEMPPTATYSRREWQYLPEAPGEHTDGRDFTLGILVTGGRRVIRTEADWYAVQVEWDRMRECEAGGEFVWSFLLENETDPDPGGPFRCVVGGMVETCGCEHGQIAAGRGEATNCKHAAALAAMIREGVI